MEFPHIGKNCSYKSCNKLDFLPMKCGACREVFCSDHFAYVKHECPEPNTRDVQVPVCPLCGAPVPGRRGEPPDVAVGAHIDNQCTSDPARERRKKVFTNKCSYKGCKTKEMVPLVCKECALNFCLRHRHATDHACEGKLAAKRRQAASGIIPRNKKTSKSKVLGKRRDFLGTRKYGTKSRYTAESLKECLEKIKNRILTQRQAAIKYNIPRSTIKNKLQKKHTKNVGRPIALSTSEEDSIVSHSLALADLGISISLNDIKILVKKYLDDNNRKESTFKDNLPGWEWGKAFLERHPSIYLKINHSSFRKKPKVNKQELEEYFSNLSSEIEDVSPENIFNFGEIGFHDNPEKINVTLRREYRIPELITNAIESCYTVIFCCNGIGEFVPPLIIYNAENFFSKWLSGAPPRTKMAVNQTGWIDLDIFDTWFRKQFLPIAKNKQGKKILIGDNLSLHITFETLRLCDEYDIKIVCLLPNSTHLLQPLDVSYFGSLNTNWRKVLGDWRQTKRGKIANELPKTVFATLLSKTLELSEDTAAIDAIAGFKACGICPLNQEEVYNRASNYRKAIQEIKESIGESLMSKKDIKDYDLRIKQKKKLQIEDAEMFYRNSESHLQNKVDEEQIVNEIYQALCSKRRKTYTVDEPIITYSDDMSSETRPSSTEHDYALRDETGDTDDPYYIVFVE